VAACVAIVPLAGWMGRATEHLAARTGEVAGGLLNATFGNAAELIIALVALRAGLYDVVKASITGSILGNILLVLGLSMLAGGIRFKTQRFNAVAARNQATMLLLAAIALILPAAFHHLGDSRAAQAEAGLSLEIAVVLLITYGLGLLFSLHTHRRLLETEREGPRAEIGEDDAVWSGGRALTVLVVATGLIAWMSEILVGSVEAAAEALGMTELFLGVIVVAIIGNAAEHSTAILVARKDHMDLALGIAIGSSVQVALFVAPILVLTSRFVGPQPMDLVFQPSEVLGIGLAAVITGQVAGDGQSNWIEGVQLLAVYAILAVVFYFLPAAS
jgi:Ca2+:H+ antiporter